MAKLGKVKLEKDTSHDTEPIGSTSGEQHAALGNRKVSSGSHGGNTTQEPENKMVVVPTSPQSDTQLPNLTDNTTITGDFTSEDIPSPTPEVRTFPQPIQNPPSGNVEVPDVHKPTMPTNIIMILGFTLILANMFVGGNLTSTGAKLLNKPEGVGPTKTKQGQALLFQFLGEVGFILLLVTLARIFPNATRPIVIFLLGVWMVWIIFILPDAIKNYQQQGLLAILGITGSSNTSTTTSSGTTQTSAPGHGKTNPGTGVSGGSYYEQGYRGYTIGV